MQQALSAHDDLDKTAALPQPQIAAATDVASPADRQADTGEKSAAPSESESTLYVEVDIDSFAADDLLNASSSVRMTTDAASPSDPATLALELAAVGAEAKRQQRELEDLQRALRLRDGWLENVREELASTREQLQSTKRELSEAQSRVELLTQNCAEKDGRIATLDAEVQRLHAETRAAIPEELELTNVARKASVASSHTLVPIGDQGPVVPLNRKVMTIGRTTESDICVPSNLVSRDHARLLISGETVTIFDIGSVNGCFVNDERVKKHMLTDGDVLRIADRSFRFTETHRSAA